jgi:hypothetical protein
VEEVEDLDDVVLSLSESVVLIEKSVRDNVS